MDKQFTLYLVKPKPKKPTKPGFDKIFGVRFQNARTRTLYYRIDIAKKCDIPEETVRNWERGLAVMPAVYWVTVCEMLYIDPWELLTGSARRSLMPDLPAHLRNPNPTARKEHRPKNIK